MYFPCFSHHRSHWFLVVQDINRRTLTLYDPMMEKASHNTEARKLVEPLVHFLPHLLDDMGVFKGRLGVKEGSDLFIFKVCDEFLQQGNG